MNDFLPRLWSASVSVCCELILVLDATTVLIMHVQHGYTSQRPRETNAAMNAKGKSWSSISCVVTMYGVSTSNRIVSLSFSFDSVVVCFLSIAAVSA